jgi:hypothetical protein
LTTIWVANRVEPHWESAPWGGARTYGLVSVYAQFDLSYISLLELSKLTRDPRLLNVQWMEPPVGALLLLLMLAGPLMDQMLGAVVAAQRYGYFTITQAFFKKVVNERIRSAAVQIQTLVPNIVLPADAQGSLDILEQSSGSLLPLRPGPPIRRIRTDLCIDIYAATMQLSRLLYFFPIGGAPDDVRGKHFELSVQEIIDDSLWHPPENIRRLRGRPLKHPSRGTDPLTDIDAIGARGDSLLIISCKSIPYSESYDEGDHRAIQSAASTIQRAVERWTEIKNFIEENPKGLNYDFSDYRKIIAVVCTPRVFYVPLGQSTQFIAPGLRAAASVHELIRWLLESEQGPAAV